jgi:carboxyl-terminal processing protease
MKKNTFLFILTLCTHLVGNTTKQSNAALTDSDIEKIVFNWARTCAQTWQKAAQCHFNPASIEQAIMKGLDAFCSSLDPHSSFLDTKAYQAMTETTSGEFCGIGVIIDNTRKSKDKFLLIIDTLPDGPADRAGMKAHDKIIDIDNKPLEGLTTEEITALLKGPRNSLVRVKILREHQQDLIEIPISRDLIKEQNSLSFYIKDHDIYYLALSIFSENAARQVERLLTRTSKKPCRGLILDLRNNSGGLLTAAIDIAGLFLEKNSLVVITKDRNGKETERYFTKRKPVATSSFPIFILVNNYTASAAEILAGFLKAHSQTLNKTNTPNPLVFLVGTTTFGKGSVQDIIPISNGCAIKLTTQLYYLPDNTTVQGTGIAPDFVVERTLPQTEHMVWLTKNYGHENTLENYIKPSNAIAPETAKKEPLQDPSTKTSQERWSERVQQLLAKDNQLRQTIALIDALTAVQKRCPEVVKTRKDALAFLNNVFIGDTPLTAEGIEI